MCLTGTIWSVAAPPVPWLSGCSLNHTSGRIVFQSNYLILLVFESSSDFTVRATAYQLTAVVVVVILTVKRRSSDCVTAPPLV